jgi:NitT/TauT family transport system substrate-binding protein
MSALLPDTFHPSGASRRDVLRAGAAAAVVGTTSLLGTPALSQPKKLTFAWSQAGFCLAPVPVALERGLFEKNGLDVELLNWAGSSDQLLEALATGKADVGVGLIHRWVKPLEAGFDVKIVGSVHGGCLRLIGAKASGVTVDLASLKGKTIGVSDLNSPAKQFYSIHLAKKGIDIEKDVEWRVYPADLLDVAVKKGEVHAIADGDPNVYLIEKRNPGLFTEVANSAKGEYAERLCCIVGARGQFARQDKARAAAVVRALAQASDYVSENPNEAAKIYAKYAPAVPVADLQKLLAELTYKHHPAGKALRDEVQVFAQDFHNAGILKKSTDPARFASHVALDVLA